MIKITNKPVIGDNKRILQLFSLSPGLAIFLAIASSPAHADVISYNGFSNPAGLTFVGNAGTMATGDGTVARVVSAGGSEAGAFYSTTPLTLGQNATFSTQFQFRFTDPGGVDPADGITFVLADSADGLGANGNGMGYAGVNNSIAIEFDTYNNGVPNSDGQFAQEPDSSNHVAIDKNGQLTNANAINVYNNNSCGFSNGFPAQSSNEAAGCMSNGDLWTVSISYNGSQLNLSLSDPAENTTFDAISNLDIDISSLLGSNTAFVGFTGSTGAGWENEDITDWTFANTATLTSPPTSVPEPWSIALLGTGLMGMFGLGYRRKVG